MRAKITSDGKLRIWAADVMGNPDPAEWMQLSALFDQHFAKTTSHMQLVLVETEWSLGAVWGSLPADRELDSRALTGIFTQRVRSLQAAVRRSRGPWYHRLWRFLFQRKGSQ